MIAYWMLKYFLKLFLSTKQTFLKCFFIFSDIVVGVYTALPEDVQESVAEGYEYMVEG